MISVIGHSGLGNILFYVANAYCKALRLNEAVELIFIDLAKNTVIQDGREEILKKTYVPLGGHPLPKYKLEEFFPFLPVKYDVDIDEYSKGRPIFHEPHHVERNCIYNIGKWNYDFSIRDMRELLTFNESIAQDILSRHEIDFSIPCVHLRLGSPGDNYGKHEVYLEKIKKILKRDIDELYYVVTEDAQKALAYLNDGKAMILIEPCALSSLYLISRFKQLILSKSTLGMWGAYLSDAEVIVAEGFEDDWHMVTPEWKIL